VSASWFGASSRRLRQRIVSEVCRRCYRDPGPEAIPTAIVVGAGRSGTTWLAEVIDSQVPCRLMFEPFNPDQVRQFRRFSHFQYMRPDEENAELLAFCTAVVRGELRGRWVDGYAAHVFSRLRLVKDIRPTPMLRWLSDRFPQLPVLFVLRHPCAVVQSRMRLRWSTDEDIQRFLRQPQLVADHVEPYLEVIARAHTDEEKHAIVWCLSNLVPLRQLATGEWTTVYYERLARESETELPRVFDTIDVGFGPSVFDTLRRPSRTTRSVIGGHGADDTWRRHLDSRQVDRILAIVEAFGLGHVYGDSDTPRADAPASTRQRPASRYPSTAAGR
jgi:hypothetical protein